MLVYRSNLVYFIIAVLGLGTLSHTAAQSRPGSGADCPHVESGVKISVSVDPGHIVYNHRLSKRELANRIRRSRGKTLSAYEQPLGLTVWRNEYALDYRPQVAQLGARKYCARIDTVSLDLVIKNMDVYVVREYSRGSCQYAAVLAHEHDHVDVARSVMTRYRGHFEAQIRAVADRSQPVIATSATRAAKGVYRQFDCVVKPLFKQMVREMTRLNNAIDTPRSYQKLFSQCSSW